MQLCDLCSTIYKMALMMMISLKHITSKPLTDAHWCNLFDFLDGFCRFQLRVRYVSIAKAVLNVIWRNTDCLFHRFLFWQLNSAFPPHSPVGRCSLPCLLSFSSTLPPLGWFIHARLFPTWNHFVTPVGEVITHFP